MLRMNNQVKELPQTHFPKRCSNYGLIQDLNYRRFVASLSRYRQQLLEWFPLHFWKKPSTTTSLTPNQQKATVAGPACTAHRRRVWKWLLRMALSTPTWRGGGDVGTSCHGTPFNVHFRHALWRGKKPCGSRDFRLNIQVLGNILCSLPGPSRWIH